jgi:plastocyanin
MKLAIPLAALLLASPATAQAADMTVTVGDDFFSPDEVRIEPGDTVTWNWAGTDEHTVTSYMGSGETFDSDLRTAPATFTHTFNKRGRFQYFCKPHPASMDSVVQVGEPLPPPPIPAPDTLKPSVTGLRAKHKRLCARRTRRCRRRSTKLVFTLSEDATVRVRISRAGRTRKSFKRSLGKGRRSIKLSARGLRPGRYRAGLVARDAAGNDSVRKAVPFRVIRPPRR